MSREIIFTADAAAPPATYSQVKAARLHVRIPGLKVSIACIAEA